MLVAWDLGFQSLVVAACLLFSVIGIVIRQKWRIGMCRKGEINRLLELASEEAARVELHQALFDEYNADRIPLNHHHCAVCFSLTTARCARCKAIRYCSGRCQIIHWRQGHRAECHPPESSDWSSDKQNDSEDSLSNKHHSGSYDLDNKFDTENGTNIEQNKILYEKLALPNSGHSGGNPSKKDSSVELPADETEKISTTEISDSTLYEFRTSTLNTKSSTAASISKKSCEFGSPRSDGYLSAQDSFDMDNATSRASIVDPNKQSSPAFSHSENSANKFAKLKTEHHPVFIGIDPENDSPLRAAKFRSIDGSCEAPSSNIQENNGNSIGSKGDVHENSVSSSINNANNKSFSEIRSFLHFSFSLSRGTSPSNIQVSQVNDTVANGILPTTLVINKATESTLLSDTKVESLEVRTSPLSCEGSRDNNNTVKELPDPSPAPVVSNSESRDVPDSNTSLSSSFKSETTCPIFIESANTSSISKDDTIVHLPSIIGRESVPSAQSRKVGTIRVGAGVSPLDANILSKSFRFRPLAPKELGRSKLICSYADAGKYNYKGHFPYELFVNLFNWKKMELLPSGLVNCGNSCYANVVLQCLTFTPPLTAYFLQGLHSKACAKERWCFSCEFESLILEAKEGKSPLSPLRIISQLRKIGNQLMNGKEEDAHEFLRYAIDTMQSICFMEAQISQPSPLEEETSLIGLTFGGYLLSKIKCTMCGSKSEQIERVLDFTVEISGDIDTIEEALQQFTNPEILDGNNRYQCSRCKSYVKAKKRLSILEAPNILTIVLKRFQSGKFGKLSKPVIFTEILDLAPYMSSRSDKSPVYRLYGVIVHLDVMNATFSGHYVCYIRNNRNKWFKIDDSTVTAMDIKNVLTSGAYMLFYARCSPRAPRLMRSKFMADSDDGSFPSWINGKSKLSPNSQNLHINNNSLNDSSNISSFYRKFHQLQKLLDDDLTSDCSSLFSSHSDECTCSTNSISDSTNTDNLPEYFYSNSGYGLNALQNAFDSG